MHAALRTILEEHQALAAMLRSVALIAERGPQGQPEAFFAALRGTLFYVDEVPERLHHPRESNHLFPKVARLAPETAAVIRKLEADHRAASGACGNCSTCSRPGKCWARRGARRS